MNEENILQLLHDELPDLIDDVDLWTRLDMCGYSWMGQVLIAHEL